MSITTVGDQMISEEELDRLGLPRNSLKVTDPATGKEGYRAAVEVFHQLHCLNLLRQFLHRDYYKNIYSDIQEEEEGLRMHVGKSLLPISAFKRPCRETQHRWLANAILFTRPLHRGHPHQPHVHIGHWDLHVPRVPRVRI